MSEPRRPSPWRRKGHEDTPRQHLESHAPHLKDDPAHPRAAPPFEFPFNKGFPVRDELAGIALGDGGLKGSFHAGVLHAFVMCGYYPKTIVGTSIGSVSGTVLAAASEEEDQDRRRELIERYVTMWLDEDPGGKLWRGLLGEGAPPRVMLDELIDLPRSLGEVVDAVGQIRKAAETIEKAKRDDESPPLGAYYTFVRWGAKAAWRLPARRKLKALSAFGRHCVRQALRVEPLFPDGAWDGLQLAFDAFGMRDSLSQRSFDESPFADFFRRSVPRYDARRMCEFARSHLMFQVANVSQFDEGLRAPRLVQLDGDAMLWRAIRAACALTPVFRAERARDVLPDREASRRLRPDDQLVDGSIIQHAPLAPLIGIWKEAHGGESPWGLPSYRLFTVYFGPRSETTEQRKLDESAPAMFDGGLRALRLRWQEDLEFNARVVSLVTQMVRVIRRWAAPDEEPSRPGQERAKPAADAMLRDPRGRPYLAVDLTTIAPADLLPMEAVSVPEREDHLAAITSGCRATLEALHGSTILEMGGEVECEKLLVRLSVKGIPRDKGYLRPVETVCAGCSRRLRVKTDGKRSHIGDAPPAPFEPFDAKGPEKPPPLDVLVPAGGVFRGVFQVGAIAAFKAYGVKPSLYAGASVGTIISYLLESANRGESDEALLEAVRLMQTVPAWVDKPARRPGSSPGKGRFDELREGLEGWWEGHAELHALSPRAAFRALADARPTAEWAALASALKLDGAQRDAYRKSLAALTQGRLKDAVGLFDTLAAAWNIAQPAPPGAPPDAPREVIGLQHVEAQIRTLAFDSWPEPGVDRHIDINDYARHARVRFLFTVTDHDRGVLVYLGAAPNRVSGSREPRWPRAVESGLAASSFPIAFRLRTQSELFDVPPEKGPLGSLYADGGILNNFPSDLALAYLRGLSVRAGYEWLARTRHRVLLLSLTEPAGTLPHDPHDEGLVSVARRWLITAENEKVHQTLITQQHINRLARHANPLFEAERQKLRERLGEEHPALDELKPAVRVGFVHIAPAQPGYPHMFAYKPELGFTVDKQNELMAAGCRRARLALEWSGRDGTYLTIEDFERRVRAEIDAELRGNGRSLNRCLLGAFTPAEGACCAFLRGGAPEVYEACARTAFEDEPMRDLVGRYAAPEAPQKAAITEAVDRIERTVAASVGLPDA